MSTWLVGWRGLEIWVWSWRRDGVSVPIPTHVLFPSAGDVLAMRTGADLVQALGPGSAL